MVDQSKTLRRLGSTIVFLVAFLLMFLVAGITAHALEGSSTSSSSGMTQEQMEQKKKEAEAKKEELKKQLEEQRQKLEQQKQQRLEEQKQKAEERKAEAKQKLEENKLAACQKHEDSINQRMQKIAERVTKQQAVFDKIFERTQTFYTDKGLSVDNYDVLVQDVEAKKAAVQTAIETLKTNTVDFQCESDDPVGVADGFKNAREEVAVAMKEYKTSIKNLIVAVKTAAEAANNSTSREDN